MPNFKTTDLTTSSFVTEDSVIPCVQNGVTKQISVLQIKQYLDDGTVTAISSGPGLLCNPNPITSSGVISFESPGLMSLYAGSTDPSGWLICDGRSLLVASYQPLFNQINYVYGGSGLNFNLPNLMGRAVFGLDDMGSGAAGRVTIAGASTLGTTAGFREHALTEEQVPLLSHTHAFSGSFSVIADPRHAGNENLSSANPRHSFNTSSGAASVPLTLTIATSSSATLNPAPTHPNLPPFFLLNWIIKI